jgi:hypothetical protein
MSFSPGKVVLLTAFVVDCAYPGSFRASHKKVPVTQTPIALLLLFCSVFKLARRDGSFPAHTESLSAQPLLLPFLPTSTVFSIRRFLHYGCSSQSIWNK